MVNVGDSEALLLAADRGLCLFERWILVSRLI
jgi:hypothetical protein